jgi:hypothetical protein
MSQAEDPYRTIQVTLCGKYITKEVKIKVPIYYDTTDIEYELNSLYGEGNWKLK